MKKCKYCLCNIDKNEKICPNCHKKQKTSYLKKVTLIISILIILLLIGIGFKAITNKTILNKNKKARSDMTYDARTFISNALLQYTLDTNTYKNNCYSIYGSSDSIYENAGNYIGSVLIKEDASEIWLSDGKYMIRGTYDNLDFFESNLTATQTCNK